jgi:hypothetical protein
MVQHKTNTEKAADGMWVATCSCGWESPYPWANQSDAEAVTGEHLADVLDGGGQ